MAVTSKELAEICGVSRGTVDRALNNKSRVDPATKARILEKAKELGYRPNPIARSLVSGRSRSIGVLVYDIRNRYFALLLNAIEMAAKRSGYLVNITLHESDPGLEERMIAEFVGRKMDGILLCPVRKGAAYAAHLSALGVPVVSIGNYLSDDIPHFGMDERAGAAAATELIVSKGYEEIVFYCPPLRASGGMNTYVHDQRLAGFRDVVARNPGVSSEILTADGAPAWLERRMETNAKRTACFCSGDIFALDLMKRFRSSSIAIPARMGLMGFDGIDTLEYVLPALSTVYNPVEEIGRSATESLIGFLESGAPIRKKTLIPYVLVPGETL